MFKRICFKSPLGHRCPWPISSPYSWSDEELRRYDDTICYHMDLAGLSRSGEWSSLNFCHWNCLEIADWYMCQNIFSLSHLSCPQHRQFPSRCSMASLNTSLFSASVILCQPIPLPQMSHLPHLEHSKRICNAQFKCQLSLVSLVLSTHILWQPMSPKCPPCFHSSSGLHFLQ